MSFRAKIFLAILLPAVFLATIAVTAFTRRISNLAEEAANGSFRAAGATLRRILLERSRRLDEVAVHFQSPRFRALVRAAVEEGDLEHLRDELRYRLEALKLEPDLLSVRGAKGESLHRQTRWEGGQGGGSEELALPEDEVVAITSIDGRPCLARKIPCEPGFLIVGSDLKADLSQLSEELGLRISLSAADGGSLYAWSGRTEAGRERVDQQELQPSTGSPRVMLRLSRSTSEEDLRRRETLQAGVAAIVVVLVIAGAISARVSKGISRPVDALVKATQLVGGGDYSAKVEVAGRDEMARLGIAFNEMTEGLRKRREIMEKTLSKDVAERLMSDVRLGGERREVTILFMDVRGFTSMTEGMDPAEVVEMLNGVLDRLARAISRNRGNVNKYLGDGIMAMFGAPTPTPDHAFDAVQAAIEMQKELAAWNASRTVVGKGLLKIGIGVNTGTVLAGNVGSRERLEYTLIGEEVNLASRLCSKAGPGQIYVSKVAFEKLGGRVAGRAIDPINVKGLSYPVSVFVVEP